MSQMYPLDSVIRKVDCSKPPDDISHSEKRVIIDAKKGEVLPKKPLISFRDLRCYLVSTQNYANCEVWGCQIKHIATARAVSFNITYRASCESGKEADIVKLLFKGPNPQEVLGQFFKQYLQDFALKNNGGHFIDDYFSGWQEKAEAYLNKRANQEIDLNLELRISLTDADKIKPLQIQSDSFPVRVKDYAEEMNLKIKEAMLQVNEDNKINIIATNERSSELQALLQEKIGAFLRENVTLHEFCDQLESRLREKLIHHLNNVLLERGRKISALYLESSDIVALRPKEAPLFKYEIDCTIKDSPTPICVEHDVLMQLNDLGKYWAAKIEDLETWFKEQVKTITQTMLLEQRYADLILDFDSKDAQIEHDIKKAVEQKANSIGYAIKHLFVIPNLDPIIIKREGISFEETNEFVTYDARVRVRLSIVVEAEINRIENIKPYLHPQTKLLDEFKKVVTEQARLIIHKIEPERFYMRFWPSPDNPNEVSVEQELKKGISDKLKDVFQLENITITPKRDSKDDPLAERLHALQEGFHDFTVETFPLREAGHEESVTFNGKFQILAVDQFGWYTFQIHNYQSKEKEIADIRSVLEQDIKTSLEPVPTEFIRYRDQKTKNEIHKIFNYSVKKITEQFGLVVKIVNIERLPTASEKLADSVRDSHHQRALERLKTEDQMASETNEAHLKELEILLKKEQDLIEAGIEDDDPEMEATRKNIEKLSGTNTVYSIGSEIQPQFERLSSSRPSAEEFSFEDFHQQQNQVLPSRKPTKRLGKDTTEENEK
ncbi:MAG: hypothetical protein VSS75_004645 [Candidatus Parabeggiatoa sp.]|nr:hypothetical protein [Candidatus Parabeggiatoa sp.]